MGVGVGVGSGARWGGVGGWGWLWYGGLPRGRAGGRAHSGGGDVPLHRARRIALIARLAHRYQIVLRRVPRDSWVI